MPPDGPANLESYLPRFGLTQFRLGQREVIATVLGGRDCLCVMPTGGGKSLCYQLPALVHGGLTLVVSPLIALMKDQVDQLQARDIPVTFINSTLSLPEQYERLERMAAGEYRLVYVVPERFRSPRFLEAVRAVDLKLLAIDEAHCISEWGHDFRPDYARLGKFRRMLGSPPTIALTATATDSVRRDIVEQLDLNDPRTFITGFARPNLFYEVEQPYGDRQKIETLVEFLGQTPGAGIIYTSSRKKTQEVAKAIADNTKRNAVIYHAGLLTDQRHAAQDAWMSGRADVVVATNAFGMGIDKPDVRFVVHYSMPGTLEAYYQEAGRAGRDGKPSRCLLLYYPNDRFIQEYFIENAYPSRAIVEAVHAYLCEIEADPIERTQQEIKEDLRLEVGSEGVGACEHLLESAGVLERLVSSQNLASVRLDSELPTLVDLLPRQATVRRKVLRAVERIVGARRNEIVPFRLHELIHEVGLDQSSVTGALRELNQLKVFTYVPPFRGRAIRMLDRETPFDALSIDFETLEKRKAGEYEKLQRVVHYATSSRCRQQQILRYFGDVEQGPCGHCDICASRGVRPRHFGTSLDGDSETAAPAAPTAARDEPPAAREPLTVNQNVVEAVRMALAGVARASTRFRCGKTLVAQMLCGSTSKRMEKLRLNKLSTFGLLDHLLQTDVVALLDGLLAAGLLKQDQATSHRPVVQLTPRGTEVMKGQAELPGELPLPDSLMFKLRSTKSRKAIPEPEKSRTRLVAEKPQPAPRTPPVQPEPEPPEIDESLLSVQPPLDRLPGAREFPSPQAEPPRVQQEKPATGVQPSHYWTWRLLSGGFGVEDCTHIRGLSREVVLDHALRALEEGLPLRPEWCLARELIDALQRLTASVEPSSVRQLLDQLPPGTSYQDVHLYLQCRRQRVARD